MSAASLSLIKAQAFGNDFLLGTAADAQQFADLPALARRVCDRHRGVGADGLMLVEETRVGAETRLFNADGSMAEVSGNGVRCAAAWIASRRRIEAGTTLIIGTAAGRKTLTLIEAAGHRYTFLADMGRPTDVQRERLDVDGAAVEVVTLGMGNPQCVVLGPATPERLHTLAARLAVHPRFPHGTNVELVTVEAADRVRILIWERGVGPTEASGTGACASAVAAAFAGGASRTVEVASPGGVQRVTWTDQTVWLTGWAELVATIEWWGGDEVSVESRVPPAR